MSVSDILQQMAQNAGRARLIKGGIYGNLVASAAEIPGQIAAQREADALQARGNARLNAADARAAAQDARQIAEDRRASQADEYKHIVAQGLAAAVGDGSDPTQFDGRAAFTTVKQLGHPEAIRDVIAAHRDMLPKLTAGAPGSVLRNEAGQVVPGSAIPEKSVPFNLPPGETRYSGEGAPIVTAPVAPVKPPAPPALGSPADYLTRYAKEHGLNPATMTTAQTNAALKQHRDATQKDPAADPFAGATSADLLDKMPAAQRAQAQALVDGRRALDPRLANKPYGVAIINAAYALDPTFDTGNYNARVKARTDLTSPSGTGGKTINALNTAIQHAGKLSDLIETLDNYEYPLANAVVNPLRTAAGSTKVTNYNTVAPQLAKEIERVWRGAGGTAGEIKDLVETIGSNKGKQQQREALQQFVELAKGKLDTVETQRDAVMGKTAGATIPVLYDQNKPIVDTIAQRAGGKPAEAAPTTAAAPLQQPIPGVPGAIAESTDGGKTWHRVK